MKFGKDYYIFQRTFNTLIWQSKASGKDLCRISERVLDLKGSVLDFGCALGSITSAMVDIGIDASGLEIDQWYVDNWSIENLKPSRIKFI